MKTHIVHWVSSVNGSVGNGKKLFEKEDAERLAAELNVSYPDIDHEAILSGLPAEPANEPSQAGSLPAMKGPAPDPQAEAGPPPAKIQG
jgi:hypothetical protein